MADWNDVVASKIKTDLWHSIFSVVFTHGHGKISTNNKSFTTRHWSWKGIDDGVMIWSVSASLSHTMTSFMIKDHEDRLLPLSWIQDPECPFCRIIKRELPSLIVYEDEKIIAFLGDIWLTFDPPKGWTKVRYPSVEERAYPRRSKNPCNKTNGVAARICSRSGGSSC